MQASFNFRVELMSNELKYTAERYSADIEAAEYIERFRRADYFMDFCRQCPNYASRYGCPPFDADPLTIIGKYSRVRIIGMKVVPADRNLPLSRSHELMRPVLDGLNRELLIMEREMQGFCCAFAGACPYCGGQPCARKLNQPCRHPDKVRPSLEAYGFDIGKTAHDLLGIDLLWSKDNLMPEYLTLVCGLFY